MICDAFTHSIITKPTLFKDAETAADDLLREWIKFFGQLNILVSDKGREYSNTIIANMCNFPGIKTRSKYPHTPWENGVVENQNKHLGRFFETTTQQKIIHWSDQAELCTLPYNTQTSTHSKLSPYEMVFKEKPQVPNEFDSEIVPDQNSICISSSCR